VWVAHSLLGSLAGRRGDTEAQFEHKRAALAAAEALVRDYPNDRAYTHDLAYAYMGMASDERDAGRLGAAAAYLDRAAAIAGTLTAADPQDIWAADVQMGVLMGRAGLARAAGELGEAEERWRAAIAHGERLIAMQERDPDYQSSLATCRFSLAVLLCETGRQREAGEQADRALRTYRALALAGGARVIDVCNLAWALTNVMPEDRRDAREAVRHGERAAEMCRWQDPWAISQLARACEAAGLGGRCVEVVERVLPGVGEGTALRGELEGLRARFRVME
jgi:tetratricopeptide (TPR) repeat protein